MNGALRFSTALAIGVFLAEIASADDIDNQQQPVPIGTAPARAHDLVIEIGAGGAMRPAYDGAKGYQFNPPVS